LYRIATTQKKNAELTIHSERCLFDQYKKNIQTNMEVLGKQGYRVKAHIKNQISKSTETKLSGEHEGNVEMRRSKNDELIICKHSANQQNKYAQKCKLNAKFIQCFTN
jgi:DNA-binding winged helix-turn-helix (wHTH) protein